MPIDQKLSGTAKALLIALPCIVLAFPIKVASYHLGLLILLWLYLSIREKSLFKFRSGRLFTALPVANYMILLFGMALTENIVYGFKTLETKIPLLILPLILFSGHDLLKNTRKITVLLVYSVGVILTSAYVIVYVFLFSSKQDVGYSFKDLGDVIEVHPGYFSLYVGFAILLLILQFKSFSRPKKVLVAVGISFLIIFDLLLVARMPIIGLVAGILIYLTIVRNYKIILLVFSVFAVFLLLIGYQNPDWTHRILEPLKMLANGEFDQLQYFAYDRMQELTCSIEILQTDVNILTGCGTGDDNDALLSCYAQHGYDWVLSQRYNAHNQYLQSVLQNGIISGILCILLIAAPLFSNKVAAQKDLDFILFSSLFGIFSLTESTLEVQKGIIFFSFFYTLFAYYVEKEKNAKQPPIDLAEQDD